MNTISQIYKEQSPIKEKELMTVELNAEDLDMILRGLEHIHQHAAQLYGTNDQTPVEDCRKISNLYYSLKY